MPASTTYTYTTAEGRSFGIVVSGKTFGEVSDSESEGDPDWVQARDSWLQLLHNAMDVAFQEAEGFTPNRATLVRQELDKTGGQSPLTVLDWRYPSDVSTEVPSSPTGSPIDFSALDSPPAATAIPESPAAEVCHAGDVTPREGCPRAGASATPMCSSFPPQRFQVNAPAPYGGVQYRRSKCLDSFQSMRFAENGTRIWGWPEDDGAWVQTVEGLYLPVETNGERLLRASSRESAPASESKFGGPYAWTCCARGFEESEEDPFLVKDYAPARAYGSVG